MSTTKNQPRQEQKNHQQMQQKTQQQKTKLTHGPKKQSQNPSSLQDGPAHNEQELPELRMFR